MSINCIHAVSQVLFYKCHAVTVTVVTLGVITVILIIKGLKTRTKKQSPNERVEIETDHEAYATATVANPYQRPTIDDMVNEEIDKV